jgi:hypothetical protein
MVPSEAGVLSNSRISDMLRPGTEPQQLQMDNEASGACASQGSLSKPARDIGSTRTWVEAVYSCDQLTSFRGAWECLAEAAIEPNVFYEPWQLLPALDAFGADKRSIFLFIHHCDRRMGAPFLIGFFPLQRVRDYRSWPANILAAWQHSYCVLNTPLLHRDFAKEAWLAAFRWTSTHPTGAALLEFPLMLAEGPSYVATREAIRELGCSTYLVERFSRALLRPSDTNGDDYIRAALSGGVIKELRRQRRRLKDLGSFEFRALESGDDLTRWIDQFITLEAAGWKGAEGTAIACRVSETAYFRSIVRDAHVRGRLHMVGLFINDRPVAMKCDFLAGDGAFSLKIAYDETYSKFSPGVLLELDNIGDIHRRSAIRWMDSCAVPQHAMIDRLWRERRNIEHVLIAPGGMSGKILTMLLFPFLRAFKRICRRKAS